MERPMVVIECGGWQSGGRSNGRNSGWKEEARSAKRRNGFISKALLRVPFPRSQRTSCMICT